MKYFIPKFNTILNTRMPSYEVDYCNECSILWLSSLQSLPFVHHTINTNVFLNSFPVVATGMEIYRRNCTDYTEKSTMKREEETQVLLVCSMSFRLCVHQSLLGMRVCVCRTTVMIGKGICIISIILLPSFYVVHTNPHINRQTSNNKRKEGNVFVSVKYHTQ